MLAIADVACGDAARELVAAIDCITPLAEAALLVPLIGAGLSMPGPAWPQRRVRPVDPTLPSPAPHPSIENVFLAIEHAEVGARTGFVAAYDAPPVEDAGLAAALEAHGDVLPDGKGGSVRWLEIARWDETAQSTLPAHRRMIGLLEDGRWGFAGSSATKPFDLAGAPTPRWVLTRAPDAFRGKVAAGLRRNNLECEFPIERLLRQALVDLAAGKGIQHGAFAWIKTLGLVHDPQVRAALESQRNTPTYERTIGELLEPPKEKRKRKRK